MHWRRSRTRSPARCRAPRPAASGCARGASQCWTATRSSGCRGCMIKGGGAALTREKIVADLAERFVCIADESKLVKTLGSFPLPVEVIPMAAAQVARRFKALGGDANQRAGVVTDNGNVILDVRGLSIADPLSMESEVNQ